MSGESSPSFVFGLVCEGPADDRTVRTLVQRVIEDHCVWVRGQFDKIVRWTGVEQFTDFTKWSGEGGISQLAKSHHIRLHGKFSGILGEGRGDAIQAVKALRLFRAGVIAEQYEPKLEVVFLIRDTDGILERHEGMRHARDDAVVSFEVVLGVPHTKRECWILTAFVPTSEPEMAQLEELESELGFDPTDEAHQLTAATTGAKKNVKRVLGKLIDSSGESELERERVALEDSDLDALKQKGREVGLREFLEEVEQFAVPLFRASGHS